MTINNLSGESICIPFGASRRLSWQHLLGCLSWAERRLLMGWRRRKGRLGWYTRAVLLLHRVVCVVEKDVAPPDPCSGARLERVTYRIHNLNASVRVKNSVTSPALEGRNVAGRGLIQRNAMGARGLLGDLATGPDPQLRQSMPNNTSYKNESLQIW